MFLYGERLTASLDFEEIGDKKPWKKRLEGDEDTFTTWRFNYFNFTKHNYQKMGLTAARH